MYERLANQSREHGNESSASADRFETLQADLIALYIIKMINNIYGLLGHTQEISISDKQKEIVLSLQERIRN